MSNPTNAVSAQMRHLVTKLARDAGEWGGTMEPVWYDSKEVSEDALLAAIAALEAENARLRADFPLYTPTEWAVLLRDTAQLVARLEYRGVAVAGPMHSADAKDLRALAEWLAPPTPEDTGT